MTDKLFFILGYFLPIYPPPLPLTTWKIKIKIKWKKCLEISSFYTSIPKIMIICYTVPEIRHMTDVFFILGYFLPFYSPPNSPKNQNLTKMKKQHKISTFYTNVPKIMIRWCTLMYSWPQIWCTTVGQTDRQTGRWMDGRMEGQKKWHTEVTYRGGCPI